MTVVLSNSKYALIFFTAISLFIELINIQCYLEKATTTVSPTPAIFASGGGVTVVATVDTNVDQTFTITYDTVS